MKCPKLIGGVLPALFVLTLLATPLGFEPTSYAKDSGVPVTPSPTPTQGTRYGDLPLGADIEMIGNHPDVKVRVTVMLPSAGFEIVWGQTTRTGNTVTAELGIWQMSDAAATVITSYVNDYSLGNLRAGRYMFVLKAWGRIIGAEIINIASPVVTTPTPSPTGKPSPTPTGTPGVTPVPQVISASGKLVKLPAAAGAAFKHSTHGLLKDGMLVLALASDRVDLSQYVDKEVSLEGNLVHSGLGGGPPLVNVLKIDVKLPLPTPRPTVTPTPKPTLTPAPPATPTPTPTVTPRPAPVTRGTSVVVGSAHLPLGKSVRIPVTVKNITARNGLSAFDLSVRFKPEVVRVDDVVGGTAPFDAPAAKNIVNGQVLFTGFQTGIPGPKGDIIVAYLLVTAVATTLSTTPLDITVSALADASGDPIPATPVRGWVSVLPTNAEAVVRLVPAVGPDRIAVINLQVDRVRNTLTNGEIVLPDGIRSFNGQATFNPDRINILGIRGTGVFNNPVSDVRNDAGTVTVGGSRSGASGPGPVVMAQLVPRIAGSTGDDDNISLLLDPIDDGSDSSLPSETTPGLRLKRGDANNDGKVDIVDALWIAQFSVGVRGTGDQQGEVHSVNGASVKPDGASGDRLDMTDALFIAQYKVGLRNGNFEMVR
ncbi:MAG: hypothetical protein HY673_16825 [Chloroflexi bacterium]|nr:hypothetical protein [Chloroflexota bacterium]